jgi:hypothetical protein
MPSLWTDDDHSAHPWIAGRPHGAAPVTTHAPDDEKSEERRFARPAVMAAACAAAAIGGALLQVLR